MNIKIKKQGEIKQFKLISKWSDVTLENWLKLINLNTETKSSEALETIAELSNIPKNLIKQLELRDIAVIMSKISELQAKEDSSLKRIIKIGKKKYGFHPDLESITLGEYADIESFIKNGLENNLPQMMSVLYRPIIEETENGIYTIEAYDGNISIRAEEMKKMASEQVQGALVFFWHLGNELLKILPSFLVERLKVMQKQSPQNLLQKSGDTLE
jgi:hypothetical protein|tara:strand:- start:7436 stop:8080 length:645 start_codon:yes stop_codon:yes gene_type:complete